MQNNKLVTTCLILCTLSILFAGALIQKPNDSSNDEKNLSEPTVRMVSSFPVNKNANYTSWSSFSAHEKLIITNIESNSSGIFLVSILNNGSTQTKITDVLVNYQSVNIKDTIVIQPNACAVLLVSLDYELEFLKTYEIKVQTLEGCYAESFYVMF